MFPNLAFAAVYLGILVVVLGLAAYVDWTTLKVPKRLTVGLLGAGLVMNLVRGAWLGAEGRPGWLFDGGIVAGAFDGLLFAVVGFLLGFTLFFGFWIFGLGGGGDVKLVGAAGAWLGWQGVLIAVGLSLPFLVVVTVLVSGYRMSQGKLPQTALQGSNRKRAVTTYSLPFALGVYSVIAIGLSKALTTAG